MDLKRIIQNFNDGDWVDISPIFNRKTTTFLKFLKSKNLLDRIDINQLPEDDFPEMEFLDSLGILDGLEYRTVPDEQSNRYLLYILEKNPSETLKFFTCTCIDIVWSYFFIFFKMPFFCKIWK